ncbi:MAG TPA: BTAD domain-containing putative transcriptional regulator [Solirubrobacter sp.]
MPNLRFRMLGPLEVERDGHPVAVAGRQQRVLLALLLLHANQPVTADRLIEELWSEPKPARALKRLQLAVTRLRKVLATGAQAGPLETVAEGYRLTLSASELDVDVFRADVREGREALEAGNGGRAAEILRRGLGLWRGSPLADLAYEPFAASAIRELEDLRLEATELAIEAELAAGRHRRVVPEIEVLLAQHPLHERLHGHRMLALYRCGRQSEALEAFRALRHTLISELGLEPGPELRQLELEILRQSPALAAPPPVPNPARAPHPPTPVELPLPRALQRQAAEPAFVGRQEELARLTAGWDQARAGAYVAIAVDGEGGIGKTRLAGELARAVHGPAAPVLYGRCDEALAVPYQPFVEALRPLADALGIPRMKAELGGLAAKLRRLWPESGELGEPLHADPESERFALFEAVAALLELATRHRPLLLVLDDLQWAADPTVLMLRHVTRSDREIAALVVAGYRDTDIGAAWPLRQLLADPDRGAAGRRVSLRGLEERAIAELLAAAGVPVDDRGDAAELVRALKTQTAGNPFFIRTVVARVIESGDMACLETPGGLRDVVGHRIARLSPPARRLLDAAAVAGPAFSMALLEPALGHEPGLRDALDEAVGAGLVTDTGAGELVFVHALVRETVYQSLSPARRARLHLMVGEALEALGDPDTNAEALSHHFAQTAAGARAARYALLAGRRAMQRLGFEQAVSHYQRGLVSLAPDAPQRGELLLALADARWSTGELELARHVSREAATLAEAEGDGVRLGRAALLYAGPHFFLATGPRVELLERALAALDGEDSALRARLLARRGASYSPGAVVRTREAIEMARRIGDDAVLADVLTTTRLVFRGPDEPEERFAEALELARAAERVGDVRARATAHEFVLQHHLVTGDMDGVERELEALRGLTERSPLRYARWLLGLMRARQAFVEGRLQEAETLADQALGQGGGLSAGSEQAAVLAHSAQTLHLRREQARMEEVVGHVEAIAVAAPLVAAWHGALAFAYVETGRHRQARAELDGLARTGFETIPRDAAWMVGMGNLAEVVSRLGHAAAAEPLYELLLPFTDRVLVQLGVLCLGSASRSLGLLAALMERYDAAATHFEDAVRMNQRIRSPLWVARTRCDYARLLGQQGEHERALPLLEQALATAEGLALPALERESRALLRDAVPCGPPWRAARAWRYAKER